MVNNYNQKAFEVISKIRNKYKQHANVDSIYEQIIESNGNDNPSEAIKS